MDAWKDAREIEGEHAGRHGLRSGRRDNDGRGNGLLDAGAGQASVWGRSRMGYIRAGPSKSCLVSTDASLGSSRTRVRARRVVYGEGEGKEEGGCARARTGGRVGDIGSLGEDVLAGQRSV